CALAPSVEAAGSSKPEEMCLDFRSSMLPSQQPVLIIMGVDVDGGQVLQVTLGVPPGREASELVLEKTGNCRRSCDGCR
ncbi:hypothetical protein NFI96_031970, partial [Prochilodus magdalenae]